MVELKFDTAYSWLWLLVFLAASLAYAWFFYRKDRNTNTFNPFWLYTLTFVRASAFFTILFLLLGPILEMLRKEVEKPIVILLHDDSESIIKNKDSLFYQTTYREAWDDFRTDLANQFLVHSYSLGASIEEQSDLQFTQSATRLSGIKALLEENYYQRNVGAVVLATDGIFNRGSNPVYELEASRIPIYAIALGDTTIYPDLRINQVVYNKMAFLGNRFPVRIELSGKRAPAGTYYLRLTQEGKEISKTPVEFSGGTVLSELELELLASETGILSFEAELIGFEEEMNLLNNRYQFVVEVLDQKQKILFLALAPHPDVAAIRQAIEVKQHYELEFSLLQDFRGELKDYNLLILHQVPGADKASSGLSEAIANSRIPVWYVLGNQTNIAQFNQWKTGTSIVPMGTSTEEVFARHNPDFNLFDSESEHLELLSSLPPLSVVLANYQLYPGAQVFAYQNVLNLESDKPLFHFYIRNEQKLAFTLGEGLWRWRLKNYQLTENHAAFDELIQKTVQYLSLKVKKDRLLVSTQKLWMQGESIQFLAEVYNPSYEKVRGQAVSLSVFNSDGLSYDYLFGTDEDQYFLEIGRFPEGDYRYRAEVEMEGELFVQEGNFSVAPVNDEVFNTEANHRMLAQLASVTQGAFFYPDELSSLSDSLRKDTRLANVARTEKSRLELIDIRWILIALLALMSFEWFVRKFKGAY